MAKNAIYTVSYRRKREGRTHYKKRLEFLKSGSDRLVIRRSNSKVLLQLVRYENNGDIVLATYASSTLKKLGWTFSAKSLPACYLAGFHLGHLAKKKGVTHAILDLGLQTPIAGSRLYAALKGVVDAGLDVPVSESIFPPEDRLTGKHIASYNDKAKDLPKLFEAVKAKIHGDK